MANVTNATGIAERMFRIVLLVNNRRPGTPLRAEDLARECGCSAKTISRTIKLMCGRPGFPLEYVKRERAYVLTDPSWKLPLVPLDRTDALFLALAREILDAQGIPHRAPMVKALDKVTSGLLPELKTLARTVAAALSPPVLPRDYAQAPVALLMEACSAHHSIDMDYESRHSNCREWRRVDPYAIEPRAGVFWELHGWCHKNQALLTFALDRVHEARDTGDGFAWNAPAWERFRREQGTRGLRGGPFVEVNAVFSPEVAAYALDRQWPDGLTITAQADGGAQLTGGVQGMEGLVVELLSWRRHVQVVGGSVLRERMVEEICAMDALYAVPEINPETNPDEK